MPTPGPIQYARNGEVSIAWREMGAGELDIVFLMGLFSHLDVLLDEPRIARFFERLAEFGRLILMDRRGTGMSDPLAGPLTVAEEVDDVLAVLDAAGSERAALLGYTSGGPLAVTIAHDHPERVNALALYACVYRALATQDYDWPNTAAEREERFGALLDGWGTGANIDALAPSLSGDERMRSWLGRLERLSTSPGGLRLLGDNFARADVRDQLPELRVPTLIMHRSGDRMIDVRHSRYAAEHIPGARYVEFDGIDNLMSAGDPDALVGEIEEFLTGGRRGRRIQRELLTVLFTDIVDSTGHAARLGDEGWRDLLATHDRAVRDQLERFGLLEVKTIGDAFLAVWGGPPSVAVRCARDVVAAVAGSGLQVRAGMHTGECEQIGDDIGGMAVHMAARIAGLAQPGQVLVSGTTFGTVVGSGLEFEHWDTRELKGVPGTWPLFTLRA